MEWVRDFSEITKTDVPLAGGKGASLGEMTKTGMPVPPGFVITAQAFEKFYPETPAVLAEEILKSFRELGVSKVAVRSSATAEDSANAAWAGQLDSFLNTTEDQLLENVKKCWASLYTPRAIFYRQEHGLQNQNISVAVVVQTMVESEMSGVAFSVHPVTEDRNQIVIEAVFGLGDKLVSGEVTPDSYVVEKDSQRILDATINLERQVLTKEQVLELANLVMRIEVHYNFPCDIEWAYTDGKFYILQSRPITTLRATS